MVKNGERAREKSVRGGKPVLDVRTVVENIVGCKWSLHVLAQIRAGVNRPGALVRSAAGLTTKVLNERLAKMVRFNLLQKVSYPEVPPRVEYHLTDFGRRFVKLLDEIDKLQHDMDHGL